MTDVRAWLESLRDTSSPPDELRAAIGTLTRVPVDVRVDASGAGAFGLVGVALAIAAALPVLVLGASVPLPAVILSLAVLAVASGAIHLDGLADTADALMAMGAGAAERARTDPAVGPGGAVALILVLGLDAASLVSVIGSAGTAVAAAALVVGACTARALVVALSVAGRGWAIRSGGTGQRFATSIGPVGLGSAVGTAIIVVVAAALAVASWRIAAGALAGGLAGAVASGAIVRWRGRLDGDAMGASIELTFASTLLSIAVAAGA
jgi:adenosylcobinamide-GDP ribazoletransferase